MSSQAGKGDDPRPVNGERFRSNYDKIFKKHESNPINPHADDSKQVKPSHRAARKARVANRNAIRRADGGAPNTV